MSKRIKTTILFFILLIISVIGNTLYTSSNLSESFFIHSEHTSDCQLQAPLPMAEKALRHLSDHSQTDLPAAAVLTHVEKNRIPNPLFMPEQFLSGIRKTDLQILKSQFRQDVLPCRNELNITSIRWKESRFSHLQADREIQKFLVFSL